MRQLSPPPYVPIVTTTPGIAVAIPGTSCMAELFPTAIRISPLDPSSKEKIHEIVFCDIGPVEKWQASIDLMRRVLWMEGFGRHGFFRIRLDVVADGIAVKSEKSSLNFTVNTESQNLGRGQSFVVPYSVQTNVPVPTPRLLLGCHKTPQWERIQREKRLEEIFPQWYLYLSSTEANTTIATPLKTLFTGAVRGIFVPKKEDDLFLGYSEPLLPPDMPLQNVNNAVASHIRALFIREENSLVTLLPDLPREFASGRLLHERLLSGHLIGFEWRKHRLRRLVLQAARDDELCFHTQGQSAMIRLLQKPSRKQPYKIGSFIRIEAGKEYLFDHFE